MEFYVTVYWGRRNVGSTFVDVAVDDPEYELLMQCCRENIGIDECRSLETVYLEITEQARAEIKKEPAFREEDDDGELVFEIELPDEIADAVEAEDEGTGSAEEEQSAFDPDEDEDDDDWIFLSWLL